MAKKCLWFLFVVVFLIKGIKAVSRESEITLQNNEYTNILVSISPDVAASSTLVTTIKTTFTKASAILYHATNQRAVFRGVTILVPSTWPTDASYTAATTQVFSNSDIVFVSPPSPAPPQSNPGQGQLASPATPHRVDLASTKAFAGCGLPAIRITMATDLLTNRALMGTHGAPEKILVHEWARFRWGVFNEYPDAGELAFYFSTITGQLEPIKCALSINGVLFNTSTTNKYCSWNVDPTTGLYPVECEYRPYPGGPSQTVAKASIMDRQSIQPIVQFCYDDQSNNSTAHNYEAPSHHNLLCGHRSTWAVISESDDFKNGINPPRPGLDTAPVFTVVQAPQTRRLVVAIDTSSSMAILVHEWARFRWGVFNEYPDAGGRGFYFSNITGKLEPIRCALSINGILYNTSTQHRICSWNVDPTTRLYPVECKYRPYPGGPSQSEAKASIMDRASVQPLVQFCEDNQSNKSTAHNYEAPSQHNLLCGHRSTWAVISESDDFKNGNNPPKPGLDTAPVFTVVQAPQTRRLVVAIDTSSSMAVDQKLSGVQQAAITVQRENTAPDLQVIMTTFGGGDEEPAAASALNTTSTSADFLSHDEPVDIDNVIINVTQLNDSLASTLANTPTSLPEAVSGGSPLSRRKRSLGASTSWQPGGHVVIVTEGHRVSDVDLTSAVARLQKAGVIVSFVLLGGPPPPSLLSLAHKTGGRFYHDNSHHESTSVTNAFLHLLSFTASYPQDAPVQIYSRSTNLKKNGRIVGQVAIDQLVATRIKFILFYTASHQALLEVEPPSHLARLSQASNLDYQVDKGLRVIRCEIPVEESGMWTYSVSSPEAQRVSLLVLASPANTSGAPVRLSGGLVVSRPDDQLAIMRIFAEATQGDQAVTGLMIEATVFVPEGDPVTVALLDNGAGADIQEGDGVYSRYFFELTHPGIYNVRLTAFGSWAQQGSNGEQEDPYKYVTRTAIAGSTLIHPNMTRQHGGDRDLLPPARIADLQVAGTISEDNMVVLTWTASGDDLDKNRASRYLILLGHSVSDLMTHASSVHTLVQEDIIHGNLSSPKEFGEREYLALHIPSSFSKNKGFALTVMAVDDADNKGEDSNYVTVSFDQPTIHQKHWQEAQKMFQDSVITRPRHRRQETRLLQVSQEGVNSNDQAGTLNSKKMMLPQETEATSTKYRRSKRSESEKEADTPADVSRTVNTGIAILLLGSVLALLVTTLPRCLARTGTRRERGKTGTGNLFQVTIDR